MNEEGCYYEMGSAVAPPSLREHCSITSFVLFICSLLEANGITYLPFWVTLTGRGPLGRGGWIPVKQSLTLCLLLLLP